MMFLLYIFDSACEYFVCSLRMVFEIAAFASFSHLVIKSDLQFIIDLAQT